MFQFKIENQILFQSKIFGFWQSNSSPIALICIALRGLWGQRIVFGLLWCCNRQSDCFNSKLRIRFCFNPKYLVSGSQIHFQLHWYAEHCEGNELSLNYFDVVMDNQFVSIQNWKSNFVSIQNIGFLAVKFTSNCTDMRSIIRATNYH